MNCPQCQTTNDPGSAFCSNCGTRMTVAPAAASTGYPPPQGTGAPLGYNTGMPQQSGYPRGQYRPQGDGGPQTPRPSGLPPVNFDHNRLTGADKIVAGGTFVAM